MAQAENEHPGQKTPEGHLPENLSTEKGEPERAGKPQLGKGVNKRVRRGLEPRRGNSLSSDEERSPVARGDTSQAPFAENAEGLPDTTSAEFASYSNHQEDSSNDRPDPLRKPDNPPNRIDTLHCVSEDAIGSGTGESRVDEEIAKSASISFNEEMEAIMFNVRDLVEGHKDSNELRYFRYLFVDNMMLYRYGNIESNNYAVTMLQASNGALVSLETNKKDDETLQFPFSLRITYRHTDLDTLDSAREYLKIRPEHDFRFLTQYYFNSKGECIKICTMPEEVYAQDGANVRDKMSTVTILSEMTPGDFEAVGNYLFELSQALKKM